MLADAYEDLRRQAGGGSPTRSVHGLAILLRRGVAAWMKVCTSIAPSAASSRPDLSNDVGLTTALQHDVVDVLATMVMTMTLEANA
jgi:hypothetical protein